MFKAKAQNCMACSRTSYKIVHVKGQCTKMYSMFEDKAKKIVQHVQGQGTKLYGMLKDNV
jgi:protein-arginine kinase activator protein McsA